MGGILLAYWSGSTCIKGSKESFNAVACLSSPSRIKLKPSWRGVLKSKCLLNIANSSAVQHRYTIPIPVFSSFRFGNGT